MKDLPNNCTCNSGTYSNETVDEKLSYLWLRYMVHEKLNFEIVIN